MNYAYSEWSGPSARPLPQYPVRGTAEEYIGRAQDSLRKNWQEQAQTEALIAISMLAFELWRLHQTGGPAEV